MVRANFTRLESLHELREGVDGVGARPGGSEFTTFLSSYASAAVRAANAGRDFQAVNEFFPRDGVASIQNLSAQINNDAASQSYDLGAMLQPLRSTDISAEIIVIQVFTKDLGAILQPLTTNDLTALLNTIPGSDLNAAILSIAHENIGGNINSVPYVNLGAKGGGHFPVNLTASLSITQPVLLPVYIRSMTAGTADLGASITRVGDYLNLPAHMRSYARATKDIRARLIVREPKDLPAFIHGFDTFDMTAFILGQHIKDLNVIIKGWAREVHSNMPAFIRKTAAGMEDIGVVPMKAVVSTHTSDKVPNLDKVSKTFHNNRYIFGTRNRGFFVLTLEPIFGIFPDLHAEIFANQYYRSHIRGFVRAAIREEKQLPTTANAVNPYVVINKVVLSPQPLDDLAASLRQVGAIKALPAVIRMQRRASTGTSDDARYSTTTASYKFILGTTKGVYIPTSNVPTTRFTFFKNSHPRPDLRAAVHGWHENDFGAYIKEYPFSALPAYLAPVTTDRFRDLPTTLSPAHYLDLLSMLTSTGEYEHLSAQIAVGGGTISLGAFINSFINPLSFTAVPVSTKPFRDMFAVINYTSLVSCAISSGFDEVSAFIRGIFSAAEAPVDIGAFLNALHDVVSMPADIVGRKRTRIRTVTLNFRAATRSTEAMLGIVVPLRSEVSSVIASIFGLSHEVNMPASITPIRYSIPGVQYTSYEDMINLKTALMKRVFVSFRSAVSSYVYEEVSEAVYPTDGGKWAIDLRTITQQDSFFNKDPNDKELELSNIVEYFSIDEAIRHALVILCEQRKENFGASIGAVGKVSSLPASVFSWPIDRFSDIRSVMFPVANFPEINAAINTGNFGSGIKTMAGAVKALYPTSSAMGGVITADVVTDLGAQVVPV